MGIAVSYLGKPHFIGLDKNLEPGVNSYRAQVAGGMRRDSVAGRLGYLAKMNYAYNYIHWLRRRSNEPGFIERAGKIERRLYAPFAETGGKTERARDFHEADYHLEEAMLDTAPVEALRDDLFGEGRYYDPYVQGSLYEGAPETIRQPMLYMLSERLFTNHNFLEICSNQDMIDFCKEVLGPAAALSWSWCWISNPGFNAYQNQNWHRDSAEPLNFIRIFVPLTPIRDEEDGPTVLIPGTSRHPDFSEVRRYSDMELAVLQATHGVGMIPAEVGDVYFVNTFALHRGSAPMRRRSILTLLVSLSPSYRTPSMPKLKLRDVPEELRPAIARNRRFFRHLIA